MSEKSKQFGVWMDSHHATIVKEEDSGNASAGHETVDGQGYNTSENPLTMPKDCYVNYLKALRLTCKRR
jgi:hypothetical protein